MSNVRKEIVLGSFYIGIAKYSGLFFQIFISAILSRLLSPADFGVVGIATLIISFFTLLSDVGISSAIVQKKELKESDYDSIFTFTVYIGIALCLLFFCCSWPISFFYQSDILLPVCQLMSFLLLLSCCKIVPIGLIMRNKEFKFQSFMTLSTSTIGGIIACIAAYFGMGVYSLLIASLVPSILTFICFFKKHPVKFLFKPDIGPLKHIFSYSIYVFLFNVVNYFSRSLDKLLVGKYVSLTDLGHYTKSYQLMMMPLNNISDVITPVLHPVFSEYQNDISFIKDKYFKFLHLVSYISFPLSVFLFFIGKEAILIVYGDQWEPAVEPFQVLSLTVSTQMLLSSTGSIYQAVNATKEFFIAGCLCACFMVTGFIVSIYGWGSIVAISWGFFFAHLLNVISSFLILCYILKASFKEFIYIITRPIFFSAVIAIILLMVSQYSIDNLVLSLIIKSVFFGVSFITLMEYLSEYKVLKYCKNSIINRLK